MEQRDSHRSTIVTTVDRRDLPNWHYHRSFSSWFYLPWPSTVQRQLSSPCLPARERQERQVVVLSGPDSNPSTPSRRQCSRDAVSGMRLGH